MAKPKSICESLPAFQRLLHHCRPELRKQRWVISGSVVALISEVLFRVLEPWPLKFVFDRLLRRNGEGPTGDSPTLLAWAALALVAILVFRAIGAYFSAVGFALAGNRVVTSLRNRLYRHIQSLPLSFHSGTRAGDLVIRLIADVGMLRDMAVTALLPMLAKALILVGMIGVMLWLKWDLALMAIAVLPLFWLRTVSLTKKIRDLARKQRTRDSAMASAASEALHGIRTVQALSLEERFVHAFSGANDQSAKADVKGKRLAAGLERSVDVLIGVATALTLWYGGVLVWRNELTPGDLLVFLAYLKYAYRPVQDIAKYAGRLAKASASASRVLDLLDQKSAVHDADGAVAAPVFHGDIHFDNISFAYEEGRPVWRGLQARIPAGTHLAIVGPSGSGKSTLASFALRLHDPQSGCVRIDGRDVREFTLESLRRQFSVVLDDTVLFAATVRENIAAAAPGSSAAEVEAAARLANAHDFIKALPDGYETVLSERGVTLSRGQRQRLAIARAALRRAPILLLDEPATGLDRANASLVLDALTRIESRRTVIHITHNPRHAAKSDLIWFIENGCIAEQGTHAELLARGGHYAALWSLGEQEPCPLKRRITSSCWRRNMLSSPDTRSRRGDEAESVVGCEAGENNPNTDRLSLLLAHGLQLDGDAFVVGRPDQATIPLVTASGAKVVAKFFTSDRGAQTFANMNALWASSFGARRQTPGLPQPLDFLADCGALIMERLEGRPLAELHASAQEHFEPALRLLADLHQCDATPAVKRSSRSIVRSAERKAARIAELSPTHAALAKELAAALEAGRVKERELVPSHGDFSPRNLFVGADRLALIDWDRFQLADPARDVVYFATYDWADWLRRGRMPNRDHLKRAIEIYESARPGAKLKRAVSFHIAAGCLRRALSILELWPDQSWLAPAWLQIGLRELTAAK